MGDSVSVWIVVSIVHVRLAGVGSVLPATSVARTSKVCEPSARFVYVTGDAQLVKVPPSRLHAKVEPPSLAVTVKVAVSRSVVHDGPDAIVVSGAVVSGPRVRLLWR